MSDPIEKPNTISEARRNVVSSLLTGGLAIWVIHYGTTLRGDSGMFPILIGGIMLLGSLGLIIKTVLLHRSGLWQKPGRGFGGDDWLALRQILVASAGLLLYALLVRPLGFFTTTGLMLLALPYALGYRHPLGALINAVIVLAMLYLIFVGVFDRPLPREFFLR